MLRDEDKIYKSFFKLFLLNTQQLRCSRWKKLWWL